MQCRQCFKYFHRDIIVGHLTLESPCCILYECAQRQEAPCDSVPDQVPSEYNAPMREHTDVVAQIRKSPESYNLKSDDEIACEAIDRFIPEILAGDLEQCYLYHDPIVNSATEITLRSQGKWVSVDWFTCTAVHPLRKDAFHKYKYLLPHDAKFMDRIRIISKDETRIRKDAERMLAVIKNISPRIIAARFDPAGDIVGIDM